MLISLKKAYKKQSSPAMGADEFSFERFSSYKLSIE